MPRNLPSSYEGNLGISRIRGIALVPESSSSPQKCVGGAKMLVYHRPSTARGRRLPALRRRSKKGIQHVLGCEMQLKGLCSALKAILEILLPGMLRRSGKSRLIRNIFHDVRGEPDSRIPLARSAKLLQAPDLRSPHHPRQGVYGNGNRCHQGDYMCFPDGFF